MTTLFRDIRQEEHDGTSPLVLEFATDEANHPRQPSKWWLEWATNSPDTSWFVYFVGDVMIGWSHQHRADFDTLAEFVACYEDMNEVLWTQYAYEVEDWLQAQADARYRVVADAWVNERLNRAPLVEVTYPESTWARYLRETSARRMQAFYDAFKRT